MYVGGNTGSVRRPVVGAVVRILFCGRAGTRRRRRSGCRCGCRARCNHRERLYSPLSGTTSVEARSFVALGGGVPQPVPGDGVVGAEGERGKLGAGEGKRGLGGGVTGIGIVACKG